jgi:hypothetical protein
MKIANIDIPAQSAFIAGAGLALLGAFALIAIYPAHLGLTGMESEITAVSRRIEEQKILAPIYREFVKEATDVPKPANTEKITTDQVNKLVDVFGKTGTKSGLSVVSVTPDPESLAKRSKLLSVTLVMRGELDQIRAFLSEISSLSFVDTLETIRIQTAKDAKELYVVAWLTLE